MFPMLMLVSLQALQLLLAVCLLPIETNALALNDPVGLLDRRSASRTGKTGNMPIVVQKMGSKSNITASQQVKNMLPIGKKKVLRKKKGHAFDPDSNKTSTVAQHTVKTNSTVAPNTNNGTTNGNSVLIAGKGASNVSAASIAGCGASNVTAVANANKKVSNLTIGSNNVTGAGNSTSVSDQTRIDFLKANTVNGDTSINFNDAIKVPLTQREMVPSTNISRTAAQGCAQLQNGFVCLDLSRNARCIAGVVSKNFVKPFSDNNLIKACVGSYCGGGIKANPCVGNPEQAIAGMNAGNEFFIAPPK